jgi:hypothetical protein
MNQEERDWLEWLKRAQDGVVTQRQAAEKMGVSYRWVRKLLVRMKTDGDGVVAHGLRSRPSNRQIDEQTQARAMELLKQAERHDFGPTFAGEQLGKRHGIEVSKETVRGWMMAAGLWKARPRQLGETQFWRARRNGYARPACGSEGSRRRSRLADSVIGVRRVLDVAYWRFRHMAARAVRAATAFGAVGHFESRLAGRQRGDGTVLGANDRRCHQSERGKFRTARRDTREHGGAVAVCGTPGPDGGCVHGPGRDVHGDAAGQGKRAAETGVGPIDTDRPGLRELGIGWIPAYSPLGKVKTMQDANKFLEAEYWPEWNERFARPLQGVTDLHRALTPQTDLASALSHVEQRVISNDYTFSFAGRRYQLMRQQVRAGMRGKSLRIELHLNGTLRARFEGQYVEVNECGAKAPETAKAAGKPGRKDHNRGGKSDWMEGFFERPGPELWQAVRTANDRS